MKFKAYIRPLALLAAVVVVIVAVLIVRAAHKPATYVNRTACAILTPAKAHLISPSLQQVTMTPAKTTDTNTTYCLYRSSTTVVALAVRTPLTKNGIGLNQKAFSQPIITTQKVVGYGDAAFWTPGLGQLDILRHNNWYILTDGSTTPSDRSLATAKKLADQLLPQL